MAQSPDNLLLARAADLADAIRDRIAAQKSIVEELVRGGHGGADDIARRHLEALEESRRVAEALVERLRLLPGDTPRR